MHRVDKAIPLSENKEELNTLTISKLQKRIVKTLELTELQCQTFENELKHFPKTFFMSLAGVSEDVLELADEDHRKDIKNAFILFCEKIATHSLYRKEDKTPIKRRNEKNSATHSMRTIAEHLTGAGKLSFFLRQQYSQNGEHQKTKKRLLDAQETLGKKTTDLVTLLSSFFHDWIEDSKNKRNAVKQIESILDSYGFSELKKYVIPIVKILTHKEWEGQNIEAYLEKIENPDDEVWEELNLTKAEKESLKILAINIKTADIVHNWKSKQTINALTKKVSHYVAFVFKHYPDLMEFVDCQGRLNHEIKEILETSLKKNPGRKMQKSVQASVRTQLAKKIEELDAPLEKNEK